MILILRSYRNKSKHITLLRCFSVKVLPVNSPSKLMKLASEIELKIDLRFSLKSVIKRIR